MRELYHYLRDPNIFGFGVTLYKEKRGVRYKLDKPIIVFFVGRKKPPHLVPREFFVPPVLEIGGRVYATDVVEVGKGPHGVPGTPLPLQTERFR
ncbi:MAG: hypothetical protein ACP5MH_11795, partial [Thermoproteus sp.]